MADDRQIRSEDRRSVNLRVRAPPTGAHQCHRVTPIGREMMLTVNLASWWQSYRMPSYRGYRFPPEIISHAVWLYHRFLLSFRDVEDFLARRGVDVTYEAIRKWCRRYGDTVGASLHRSVREQPRGGLSSTNPTA